MGSLVGPLTTTFVAPTTCPTSFSNTYVDERTVLAIGPLRKHTECFPKNFVAVRDFYYSPGVCPAGYETACSSFNSAGTVTETVVTCCPRSFTCQTESIFPEQITFGCVSRTGATWTFPTLTVLSSGEPVSVKSLAFTDPLGNTGGVNAFSIQIRYQSTDFTTPTITSAVRPPQPHCLRQN
ncbi:hypothetical protein QBC47DRAFT_216898 [Echria macrotheca]|uniref:Uncharacterized protein n=1 Tax=Echria macrotheca TaxID=438768 RepID=A0AAJ0BBQ4_9PEZI|nr:hypothetical protein QBC47DRAFT_216898 [Echria macrotheca]